MKKIIKSYKESLVFAFGEVTVNKLRTILSLSGITIGIFAIISVLTVVSSLERNIRDSIASLGENVVYVQKWPWTSETEYAWWDYWRRPLPNVKEYEEIKRFSNHAEAVCFSASTSRNISYGKKTLENIPLWLNTHEFEHIRLFEMEQGRYFSNLESHIGSNVAVIGHDIANKLFNNTGATGKEVKLGGRSVRVIGVTAKEGRDMIGGGSLDNIVLLPMNFARNLFNIRSDNLNPMIIVKAREGVNTAELNDELRSILRSYRRLKPMERDNFALNQASLLSRGLDQIFIVINLAGWLIGGFSILVGGFGIANIMFVSVKERTNIIGIQKALGAKNFFILLQFLYEAVFLSLAGGLLGLLLVFAGTIIVQQTSDFSVVMSGGNIATGLLISISIGIISGFAPAYSASRLNPVEAIGTTF